MEADRLRRRATRLRVGHHRQTRAVTQVVVGAPIRRQVGLLQVAVARPSRARQRTLGTPPHTARPRHRRTVLASPVILLAHQAQGIQAVREARAIPVVPVSLMAQDQATQVGRVVMAGRHHRWVFREGRPEVRVSLADHHHQEDLEDHRQEDPDSPEDRRADQASPAQTRTGEGRRTLARRIIITVGRAGIRDRAGKRKGANRTVAGEVYYEQRKTMCSLVYPSNVCMADGPSSMYLCVAARGQNERKVRRRRDPRWPANEEGRREHLGAGVRIHVLGVLFGLCFRIFVHVDVELVQRVGQRYLSRDAVLILRVCQLSYLSSPRQAHAPCYPSARSPDDLEGQVSDRVGQSSANLQKFHTHRLVISSIPTMKVRSRKLGPFSGIYITHAKRMRAL